MPGLYKDEGIVLKTIKLGEADRIVTLFTRDHGKVRAVAKGIRKTKSRFGARLEPFTHAALIVYRGRSLDTITQADILTSFDEVRQDYPRLAAAAALVDIVEKVTPERERATSTYRLLMQGLEALKDDKGATVVPAFLIKLLSISGYHPQLTTCAGCGETAAGLGGFSAALGGAVCASCWRDDREALQVSIERLRLLGRLLQADFGEPAGAEDTQEVTQVLRRYAEYHLERPLRSLQLLPSAQ
ncbi:MAG: DNA repair protein RecO [Actinomycetota bacterium]|nr:DNA repair protein RecO [Actinomycetota bacterium]